MQYTESAEVFLTADESTEFHQVTIALRQSFGGTAVCFTQFGTLPDGEAEQAKAPMESYVASRRLPHHGLQLRPLLSRGAKLSEPLL
jgi:hypothetical protein